MLRKCCEEIQCFNLHVKWVSNHVQDQQKIKRLGQKRRQKIQEVSQILPWVKPDQSLDRGFQKFSLMNNG